MQRLNVASGWLRLGLLLLGASALALASGIAVPAPVVHAASFMVNTTVDAIDAHPGDGVCATSSGTCSLRAAIMEANALGGGPHVITLQAGATYGLTLTGPSEDNAATGDLDIRGKVTIQSSAGTPATVKPAASPWNDRIFDIQDGATAALTGVTISGGSQLTFNAPRSGTGGGILNSGTLTLQGSTVSGNTSQLGGGGITNFSNGTLTVLNSTISGNTAVIGGGGISSGGTLTVTNSTVSNNTVSGQTLGSPGGGGIFSEGTLTVSNSTISGNTASTAHDAGGGGVLVFKGFAQVSNTTISGNSSTGAGGGIRAGGIVQLNNVTIANNVGYHGGGVDPADGSITTANSIFTANTSTFSVGPDCSGSLTSQGFNLVRNTSGCTLIGASSSSGDLLNVEPRLGPLQNNGGSTQTQALQGADVLCSFTLGGGGTCRLLLGPSIGIDAGNPASSGSTAVACLTTDQRGVSRPVDGNGDGVSRCDIGAYEAPAGSGLGTFALTPQQASAQAGEHLPVSFSWTVPSGGWRGLDSLHLLLRDDQGTALWLRFHEAAGDGSTLGLIDPKNLDEGPAFAFGSSNRLETDAATVYLATSSLDGPAGSPTVTLHLDLGLKPRAAGRTFEALVLAIDDSGRYEGFAHAGTLTVQGGAH